VKTLYPAALALLLLAAPAWAQVKLTESPRNGAFKLKVGSYDPRRAMDGEVEGNPYEETFGRTGMLLVELQYDRYLWQQVGALGLGFSAGYAEKYGAAQAVGEGGGETAVRTALHVYPMRLDVLYNFDYAALHWRIPLVPYLRGGLAYVPWRMTKGGEVEVVDGRPGRGGRWGYGFTGGLAFLLDVLDQRMSRNLDTELGINHTYLFAEYSVLRADGFGRPGINLSSSHWMFGLAFEF
jgi:hypothetical protein